MRLALLKINSRILLKTKLFSLHSLYFAIFAFALLPSQKVWSQTGVAPSQTSSFFDELRARSNMFRENAVDEAATLGGASGVYDYSRGEYTGETYEERPLGERPPIGDELVRSVGSQTYRAGYYGSSRRSVGDYTGASSSPYPSSSTYFAPTYITDPFLSGKRNIKLGPVNIGFGMNANAEYNSNITSSHDEPVDDIIAGIYLNVDANYRFSKRNQLSLTTTIGVDHYFNHPELSPQGKEYNLTVLPGTTLAFDFEVGDVHFIIYDRVSVRQASQSEFALDDLDVFGVFQNDAGLWMNWQVNSKTTLSLNYNHSSSTALEDSYGATDRVIDSVSGSLAWSPTGTYILGLEGSYSVINYDEEFNNDGTTLSGGVFIALPLTRGTLVKASVGWQQFEFDTPPTFTRTVSDADLVNTQNEIVSLEASKANVTTTDPVEYANQIAAIDAQIAAANEKLATQTVQKQADDATENSRSFDYKNELSDYYYNVTIFNQLNARISHQLSFGHESSLNVASNFITADYVTYGMGIVAWRGARISLSGYYEDAKESGGRLAEDTEQYGFDSLLTHRITDRVTAGIGYHYGTTDSATVGRDYVQHAFSFDVSYMVNQKMNVGIGYRHLITDAEDEQQSFDQDRLSLSVNYNF